MKKIYKVNLHRWEVTELELIKETPKHYRINDGFYETLIKKERKTHSFSFDYYFLDITKAIDFLKNEIDKEIKVREDGIYELKSKRRDLIEKKCKL